MATTLLASPSTVQMRLATGDAIAGTPAQLVSLLSENNPIFNDAGLANDFTIESISDSGMFHVDGTNNRIGIGTLSPTELFDIAGNLTIDANGELISQGTIIAGDPGTEGSGINVGGIVFDSILKASDIGGAEPAQFTIHRHSTTLQAALIGSRSKSNGDTHTVLANNDSAFSIWGAYWTGSHYDLCGEIEFKASSSGTISSTSSPGAMLLKTTPDASNVPTLALTIDEDQSASFTGIVGIGVPAVAGSILTLGTVTSNLEFIESVHNASLSTPGSTLDGYLKIEIGGNVLYVNCYSDIPT